MKNWSSKDFLARIMKIGFKIRNLRSRIRGGIYRLLINLLGGNCETGLRVDSGFKFVYPPHHGIHIGKDVFLGTGVILDVLPSASLWIGNEVKLTRNIIVAAANKIEIGNNVLVAEYVSIRDSDHGICKGILISKQPLISRFVHIGNDVWIGRGVAILKGACLEDGSVIGANSVVGSTIAKESIAVGVPARILRVRE